MIGEEDVVSGISKNYTCTAKCITLKGSVFKISREDFLTLKQSDDAWINILEKAMWKEKQKGAEHISQREKRINQ